MTTWKGLSSPPTFNKHAASTFPEILQGLVALWPPASISCCHQILCLWVASCLWPAMLFPYQGLESHPQVTELAMGSPLGGPETPLIPNTRPPAGGCCVRSINVWLARGGCKPLITSTLRARAVPGTTAGQPEGHLKRRLGEAPVHDHYPANKYG